MVTASLRTCDRLSSLSCDTPRARLGGALSPAGGDAAVFACGHRNVNSNCDRLHVEPTAWQVVERGVRGNAVGSRPRPNDYEAALTSPRDTYARLLLKRMECSSTRPDDSRQPLRLRLVFEVACVFDERDRLAHDG
jgi:hypothetical protein